MRNVLGKAVSRIYNGKKSARESIASSASAVVGRPTRNVACISSSHPNLKRPTFFLFRFVNSEVYFSILHLYWSQSFIHTDFVPTTFTLKPEFHTHPFCSDYIYIETRVHPHRFCSYYIYIKARVSSTAILFLHLYWSQIFINTEKSYTKCYIL